MGAWGVTASLCGATPQKSPCTTTCWKHYARKVSEYTEHHSLLCMGLRSCRLVSVADPCRYHWKLLQQASEHQNWPMVQCSCYFDTFHLAEWSCGASAPLPSGLFQQDNAPCYTTQSVHGPIHRSPTSQLTGPGANVLVPDTTRHLQRSHGVCDLRCQRCFGGTRATYPILDTDWGKYKGIASMHVSHWCDLRKKTNKGSVFSMNCTLIQNISQLL